MRRSLSVLAASAGVALALGACGSPADGTQSDLATTSGGLSTEGGVPARADADLVVWADESRAEALMGVASRFGEMRGISVAVQTVDLDQPTGFITANGDDSGPDVVLGSHDWIGDLVQNGAIDPVQLTEADQQRYVPLTLDAVRYKGTLYGLPYAHETLALYRNIKLVKKAPATVEDIATLSARADVENPLCLPVGAFHLQPLYSSAGGYLFGTTTGGDHNPTDLGVGKAGSLTAAAKLGELGARGLLKTSITEDNAVSLFTEGQCAFLVDGPEALDDVRSAGMTYTLTPMVGFAGMQPAQPFTTVQAYYVASKARNAALAQQFVLDAANSPDAMKALYDAEPRPPAMTDVLAQVSAGDADTAVFADAAAAGTVLPAIPQMAEIWQPLTEAEAAIIGGAEPESTMTSAGSTIAEKLT